MHGRFWMKGDLSPTGKPKGGNAGQGAAVAVFDARAVAAAVVINGNQPWIALFCEVISSQG